MFIIILYFKDIFKYRNKVVVGQFVVVWKKDMSLVR